MGFEIHCRKCGDEVEDATVYGQVEAMSVFALDVVDGGDIGYYQLERPTIPCADNFIVDTFECPLCGESSAWINKLFEVLNVGSDGVVIIDNPNQEKLI